MKKSLFTILAMAAVVACTKTENVYNESQEIGFTPVSYKMTKADQLGAVIGTALPTQNDIVTYGYYQNDVNAGTELANFGTNPVSYIDGAKFVNESSTLWHGSPAYYWPKVGSLVFAGYTGAAQNHPLTHSYSDNKFTAVDYVQTHNTANTTDLMFSYLNGVSYNNNPSPAGGVPMVFTHALAWVEFKVVAASDEVSARYKITSLVLENIKDKGNLDTQYKNAQPNAAWTNLSFESDTDKNVKVLESTVQGGITVASQDATTPTFVNNGILIIPQDATSLKLNLMFNDKKKNANGDLVDNWIEEPNIIKELDVQKSGDQTIDKWEFGKHYVYVITISDKEIKVAPTVTDWTPITIDNITI